MDGETPRPVTVLGISGSLRKGSFNSALLAAATSLVPSGITIETGSFAAFPVYSADLQAQGFPDPVRRLAQQVRDADALLIVSPEYNYSVPGGLKNAVDWLSRVEKQPFDGKPIAIMGASTGRLGTARMQYHLRQIFVALNGLVLNRPEVMVANATKMFDERLELTDPATRKLVVDLLGALAAMVRDTAGWPARQTVVDPG